MAVDGYEMRECAVVFGAESPLVGIISEPSKAAQPGQAAVVILNSGLDHRIGTSRMMVRMARMLCESGSLVARFDHGGIGDSLPRRDGLSWREASILETREVMDRLNSSYAVERFILMGHCAGAVAALKAAQADSRVVGAVLLNIRGLDPSPEWHRHVSVRGWARSYWELSLRSRDSWKRALTGRVDYRRLIRVLIEAGVRHMLPSRAVSAVKLEVGSDLRRLVERGARLLCVLAEGDPVEDYLAVVVERGIGTLESSERVRIERTSQADRGFTMLASQRRVMRLVEDWMQADRVRGGRQDWG